MIRLARRVAFEVRRDAATELSNGRVLYDALFSRTGFQTYGDSVEYRPAGEVFAPDSLATLANLPGVLLHPDENYGTSFGEGQHPVRGVTGSSVIEHTDGVHTAGQIMVWDDEWRAAIESGEVAELSLGYGITPGPATEIDGQAVDVVHTKIIGDHAAGVPEGNAGSARVVLDAASRYATRIELAKIASSRMDARPLHIDLGRWPRRDAKEPETMTIRTPAAEPLLLAAHPALTTKLDALGKSATPRQKIDAWIDVYGESDDPAMQAVAAALAAPAAAPVVAAAPVAPVVDAEDPDEEEEEVEADRRADAKIAKVEADRWAYADAFELARRCLGASFTGVGKDGRTDRKDSAAPMTLEALRLAVVTKVDAKAGARLGRMDAVHRPAALAYAFEGCREILDEAAKTGPALVAEINRTRGDKTEAGKLEAAVKAVQDKLQAADRDGETKIFGVTPPTAAQA